MFKFKRNKIPKKLVMPAHIAVIMDGNGRWALKRGLPRTAGHKAGATAIQNLVEESNKLGLKYLTVYAFSTENWSRPKDEVKNLMRLLREFLRDTNNRLGKSSVRIKVIGSREKLDKDIIEDIKRTEEKSKNNKGLTFIIALNYGSRNEITNAVRQIAVDVKEDRINVNDIDEQLIADYLYTKDIPDPDLIIRPSGEKRLSNFLLWQASYAEFWYSNILWPDFKVKHLIEAIEEYNKRSRRFGGLNEKKNC